MKDFKWVCNECNFPNFTSSVSESEIEQELHACISCGSFEFHKAYFVVKNIDFKEVLKAIELIREIEKVPLRELAKQYAKYSNQSIPDEAVTDWAVSGLGNEYFLTSDHLERYGLKALQFTKQ